MQQSSSAFLLISLLPFMIFGVCVILEIWAIISSTFVRASNSTSSSHESGDSWHSESSTERMLDLSMFELVSWTLLLLLNQRLKLDPRFETRPSWMNWNKWPPLRPTLKSTLQNRTPKFEHKSLHESKQICLNKYYHASHQHMKISTFETDAELWITSNN